MTDDHTVNGVNTDRLKDTIDAVKEDPVIGKFTFHADNTWINGGHSHTTIRDFFGVKHEISHRQPFEFDADEPPILLGEDIGPNPVEYLLTALASCVTGALVYQAAVKGIGLKSVQSRVEGDLDLRGFLGISEDVHKGYEQIRMFFRIEADAPRDKLEEIVRLGRQYSPVYDTITRAVPVSVELE